MQVYLTITLGCFMSFVFLTSSIMANQQTDSLKQEIENLIESNTNLIAAQQKRAQLEIAQQEKRASNQLIQSITLLSFSVLLLIVRRKKPLFAQVFFAASFLWFLQSCLNYFISQVFSSNPIVVFGCIIVTVGLTFLIRHLFQQKNAS